MNLRLEEMHRSFRIYRVIGKGGRESCDRAIGAPSEQADAKERWACLCALLRGKNGLCEPGSGVSAAGELATRSSSEWTKRRLEREWVVEDSNLWPHARQACALPAELTTR